MGRTISHQQQAANFRSHQLPLARGVRAYRFRLHSHSGRGGERCLRYPVGDSWFMLGNQFDSGAHVCGAGPGLLEPVPPPAVGVRTMTKAVDVPCILTPEAVRACRSLCAGWDVAFRKVGAPQALLPRGRVTEALREAAPDQRHI